LDFGRTTINPHAVLHLFGTPGQGRFCFMWKELSLGALGAVVLADTRRLEDSFAAVDYFEFRNIPFIVGVNCVEGVDIYEEDEIRAALDLPTHVSVVFCEYGPVSVVFCEYGPRIRKHVLTRLLHLMTRSAGRRPRTSTRLDERSGEDSGSAWQPGRGASMLLRPSGVISVQANRRTEAFVQLF
jgi:hypothetical protein